MNIYPFKAWYPALDKISMPDAFFGTIKEQYTQYHRAGYFRKFPKDAMFIYQIQTPTHSYTGLTVTTPIAEYNKGNILKHEKTLASKEKKTIELLLERRATVKPVLLTYPANPAITQLLQAYIAGHEPSYVTDFQKDTTTHRIWMIEDTTLLKQFQGLFQASVTSSYIADGHHRTTSMSLLQAQYGHPSRKGDFGQLLVTLFGSDQLKIYAFNRVVDALSTITAAQFLEAAAEYCTIQSLAKPSIPTHKHTMRVFLAQKWYSFQWKAAILERYKNTAALLDVQLLNDKILQGILDIQDIRYDQRIQYVPGTEGITGLTAATLQHPTNIGFYLFPVQIEELMARADHHQLLPPKSTYFEPRIKNGLVVRRIV